MKNICVYGSASPNIDSCYLDASYEMGKLIIEEGFGLVYGAGGEGVMGAVARGARAAGGNIVGVVPDYLHVDGVIFDDCDELIVTETIRERKRIMDERSDAFITMPGGVGTMDEFIEMYGLRQLCRHEKALVLVNINGYYDNLLAMINTCVEQNFAKPLSLDLFYVAKDPKDAIEYVKNYKPIDVVVKKLRFLGEDED